MSDILFEQKIVQNCALGAEVIWSALNEAYECSGRTQGVSFPLVFIVLPLAFHRRSAGALSSKTQPGALLKALSEDREISVGLQARMQAMADRTLNSISIGLHSGLFAMDPDVQKQLVPIRKTAPVVHVTDEVKVALNAAKRIGQAFNEMSLVQLATQLNIRF